MDGTTVGLLIILWIGVCFLTPIVMELIKISREIRDLERQSREINKEWAETFGRWLDGK
jgi:hypothetical protein